MKTLRFRGYSDDIFMCEVAGRAIIHDDDCANFTTRIVEVGVGGQVLWVTGVFCFGPGTTNLDHDPGVWSIGLGVPDRQPLPDWPMRWSAKHHTMILELDVPDDASVVLVFPDDSCDAENRDD